MKRVLLLIIILAAGGGGAVMAQGNGAARLEGQVVCCEECWVKADRKTTPYGTRADLESAAECIANGDPTLLAVVAPDGGHVFYELRPGKFKRPGKDWLAYVGKRVEITGPVGKKKERGFIKVDALTVLAPAPAESEPEVNVIGSEQELVLKDLLGSEQRLSAHRGRIVVLNFWATYCLPCRKEMPDLAAIQNEYAPLGVQVIGAAADAMADQDKVRQFIKETKLNFPVWLGASAEDMHRFGLGSALPGTVVVGRDGRIAATYRGVIKIEELKKQIESLLALAEKESKERMASAKGTQARASSVPS